MTGSAKKVPCPLRAAAVATPEAPAIAGAGVTLTYGELDRRVSLAAGRLLEAGCGPEDRVPLYLPQDENYVVLLLALVLRSDAVACPISARLPAAGVPPLLERTGCSALISDSKELLGAADAADCAVRSLRPEELFAGDVTAHNRTNEAPQLSLDQSTTIIHTSGSSGTPKAALHTFGNHYYSALGSGENIELRPGGRWLLSLPLYHVGGLSIVFRCLLAGATIVLPEPSAPLDRSIREFGVTHVSLVATQLQRLLQTEPEPGGLKAILLGGGPAPEALLEKAFDRDLPVHNSYGLTEMTSQTTATPPGPKPEVLQTSGRPLAHREVAVSREGEILVRGKTLFAGYVEGDVLERTLDAEGWFHTGDLGEFDASGNLRVLGRSDNLFISGGENVQPEEIEAALERIEEVEKAVVVPVPDSEFGERPAAFVQVAGDGGLEAGRLAETLEETLPRFKVPVAFYEWPEGADAGRMKPDRSFFRELVLRLRT